MKPKLLTFALFLLTMAATCCSCQTDDEKTNPPANCSDPNAVNFNPESTAINDCQYSSRQKAPVLIASLSSLMHETSGLASFGSSYLTHNDQGNEAEIFIISAGTGSVQRKVEVLNSTNLDWEDLAQSDEHLYIGDIGNNKGARTVFGIYRIPWSNFNPDNNGQAVPDAFVGFSFPEQIPVPVPDHDFDCEAILYSGGFIYAFTKNRGNRRTNLYRIPASPGQHFAQFISEFNSAGLITAADISDDGSTVALLGYNRNGSCFVWKLTDFEGDDFFSGSKEQIILGPYSVVGQAEAVVFETPTSLLITAEGSKNQNPRFYRLEEF